MNIIGSGAFAGAPADFVETSVSMGSGLDASRRPGMTVSAPVAADTALHVIVVDREGREHRLEALDGWRLMEVIRDWGLPIEAQCGGACACATCHVHVDPAWSKRLPPPRDEEIERLDEAFDVRPNSRLSCQLLMTPDLDGIRVRLV
jgi:2Fe-2S ferredoxin